ncbi:acyltransferase [Streptomyces purpurogeneiscleroticus]|nr:acyltransferase [Streptomyces purpurogeneiscleroticus]
MAGHPARGGPGSGGGGAPMTATTLAGARSEESVAVRSKAEEIQGFRGIAALSTVVFHVWQQYHVYDAAGSHPPVDSPYLTALLSLEVIDFFFVVSAYLLTLSYARAAIDGGPSRPGRLFLFRRAVRIVPLYFIAVLVVWSSRNHELGGNWLDLVEHLTFTHVFDQRQIFYTLGPAWSLSLEVVFYLALVVLGPLAVRACRPLRRRGARVAVCAAGCLLLFVLPVVWVAVARYGYGVPHTDWTVYFGPQARFSGFAAGMGLAVLVVALRGRGRLPGGVAAALSVVAVAAVYWLSWHSRPENPGFTFYHPLAALAWVALMLGVVHARGRVRWHRLLRARWLTYLGLVSYSLFIWHEPVMLQLYQWGLLPGRPAGFWWAVAVVLLVAVPVAVASYWVIEYPSSLLYRLRDGRGRRRDFYAGVVTR